LATEDRGQTKTIYFAKLASYYFRGLTTLSQVMYLLSH
jgi:hypothetical protein